MKDTMYENISSLKMLEIIAYLEDEFSVEFDEEHYDITFYKDPKKIVDYTLKLMNNKDKDEN